jgi:zinc-ribbon domain
MTYAYDLENGQRLIVENDGDNTLVALSSGGEGQQQSQASGFETGKWSKAPTLFRVKQGLVLRVETKSGSRFIAVRGSQIQIIGGREPDLENAEELRLRESEENVAMESMRPMEAMRPMESIRPMPVMRPMEMRMGNMHMRMGGSEEEPESEKRFCTNCGKPARKDDRFCGYCGKRLAE